MTGEEIETAVNELQTSITTHGLCYIPGDALPNSKTVAESLAEWSGYNYTDRITPRRRATDPSIGQSVRVSVAFPYENDDDLQASNPDKREAISMSNPSKIINRSIPENVHLVYIGDLTKKSIRKIAKERHPDNPVWYLGKLKENDLVLPNIDIIDDGIAIGCICYGNKHVRVFKPHDVLPTLHYYDRSTDMFVDTELDSLEISHSSLRENLSVAGGASSHSQDQGPGKGPPVPLQPPPSTPFGDFLTPTACADLAPYSYSQGAGAAGSGLDIGPPITPADWDHFANALQKEVQKEGEAKTARPGRGPHF